MNFLKATALVALAFPAAAFATSGGTATGTVTLLSILNNGKGDLIYLALTSPVGGSPPGCDRTPPYEFVLPRTTALQGDMFRLLLLAKETGRTISVRGAGICNVDTNLETLVAVSE